MKQNFEEYSFFCDQAINQSQRRQSTSQIFLSINTAILGIIALLLKDSGLQGWSLVFANAPLFITGLIVSIVWLKILSRFKSVIGWHYEQLRKMEKKIKGSYKFYSKEWSITSERNKKTSFSDLEASMPRIFIMLYLVYAIGMLFAVSLKIL